MEQANVLVYGALKGWKCGARFSFIKEISDQERLRREELVRSTKPSKQRKK